MILFSYFIFLKNALCNNFKLSLFNIFTHKYINQLFKFMMIASRYLSDVSFSLQVLYIHEKRLLLIIKFFSKAYDHEYHISMDFRTKIYFSQCRVKHAWIDASFINSRYPER